MLFAFIGKDKPGNLQVRLDNRPAHVAYLEKLNADGILKIAGPFLGDDGKPYGSLVVIEAADKARQPQRSSPKTPMPRPACSRRPKSTSGTGPSTNRPDPDRRSTMQYWLFKSEPDAFSWEKLKSKGKAGQEWDGVRNYAARNNMRAMQIGDLGFFYHSNEGLDVVGIVEVCKLVHRDSTTDDERWECVDIRAVQGRADAADAQRDQGQSEARRNGAGQARPALGAAGDASGMEGSLPHGRARSGALNGAAAGRG